MQPCNITFLPENQSVTVPPGTSLLEAARIAGVVLEAPCDGRGTCGKCRVQATGMISEIDPEEIDILNDGLLGEGVRLACKAKAEGAVTVEGLHPAGDTFVIVSAGQGVQRLVEPPVHTRIFSDTEVEQEALDAGITPLFPAGFPRSLRALAEDYKQGGQRREAILKHNRLLSWRCGQGKGLYGLAVDIGTTSVVAELFDLANGQSLGVRSVLNPQSEFGGDVLTRISFAGKQSDGTAILQSKIAEGLNRLVGELANDAAIMPQDIYEMVVAGNTTMQHLLLGISPRSLAQAPYRPVFLQQVEIRPAEIGIAIAAEGVITILPSAAAFVGADIVAGLLALGLHSSVKTTLFIDIGTNGEIVIAQNGRLAATSSAAGPALEGMNISCGCRAEQGAVEGVAIAEDGALALSVIGGGTPRGICGSGLIDLAAELVRCKIIDASGRFCKKEKLPPHFAERVTEINGQPAFIISAENHLYLSQQDVRQIQLAKGAIAAAISLLLNKLHLDYAALDDVVVAGAFGFHLKPKSLLKIGLLPYHCENKIRFAGNTAKEGAKAVLLNREASREIVAIGKQIHVEELSLHPEFQDVFVRSLCFPK